MTKNTWINSLICFTAISLGLFWLYFRVFRKIPIIPLTPETIFHYKTYLVYLQYFSITMLLLVFLTTIITFYLKNKLVVEKNLLSKTTKKISEFFTRINIFFRAYEILFKATSGEYIIYIVGAARFCLKLKKKTNYIIILLFVSLPRIIIIISLCLETYYGQLYYYFYSLLLLLVPLVFKLTLFMLKDVGHRVLPELNQMVQQSTSETMYKTAEGVEKKGLIIHYSLTPEHADMDFDWLMQYHYYPALFIEGHIEKVINPKVYIISRVTQALYYSITLIVFTYILYL